MKNLSQLGDVPSKQRRTEWKPVSFSLRDDPEVLLKISNQSWGTILSEDNHPAKHMGQCEINMYIIYKF